MKAGYVALLGRTNAGKSTLVNALIGQKVAITSPKPRTTELPIEAIYEDDRGQIIFIDTPGQTGNVLNNPVDIIVYVVDHTRQRGLEENKILGIIRQFSVPKILVFNKIDRIEPDYRAQYRFLEDEVDEVLELSALENKSVKLLMNALFDRLPEREKIIDTKDRVTPILNMDSKMYIAELIREKVFLSTGQEVPYHARVTVDEIVERNKKVLYIKARIIPDDERYKKMLIGKSGQKIKQLGFKTRRELELITNKKVYLELTVEIE